MKLGSTSTRAGRVTVGRWLPVLAVTAVAITAILPFVFLSPQHPDENQYAWSAGYFGKKVLAADFGSGGSDIYLDPGWDPDSYWGRSMGTRAVMALGLATPWAKAPELPYSYAVRSLQGKNTEMDHRTLVVLRLLATVCAVVGAALLAWRLGWIGALAVVILLAVPHNAENFARAWAEGPLLLAFGAVAAAYGSRWFPFVLGVASTVKFTVVGLWPLVLIRAAHGWRSRALALVATVLTWVVLTPPSWYRGGPGLLLKLAQIRVTEYGQASATVEGAFLPSRYFWPLELGALLVVLALVAKQRRERRPGPSRPQPTPTPLAGDTSTR